MPKGADLHSHLTGAVYAESYIEWAAVMPLCIDLSTSGYSMRLVAKMGLSVLPPMRSGILCSTGV